MSLPGYEVHSAEWAGFKGKANGELLGLVEAAGYDVFLTVDLGIQHQHNLKGRKIAIIIVRSIRNDIDTLKGMTSSIALALARIRPGEVVVLDDSPVAATET